jgi:hypothetical protein
MIMRRFLEKHFWRVAGQSLFLVCAVALAGCSIAPLKQRLAPAGTSLDRYPQIQRDSTYRCTPDSVLGVGASDCRIDGVAAAQKDIDHDLHVRFQAARAQALKGSEAGNVNARNDAIPYFKTGKALIQTLCSRWFDSMELEERRLDGVDKSFNVWKAFGTTLLGLGNASSAIVSLYGGATTLESGLSTAYKDVYLLGGSISKVKLKIFGLLDQYAGHVEGGAITYETAYVALERMGTLCSPATAKLIIDAGVDAVHLSVSPSLLIEPTSSPVTVALADLNAIAQQRDALSRQETELTISSTATDEALKKLDEQLGEARKSLAQAEAEAKALPPGAPEGETPEAAKARTESAERIQSRVQAAKATVDRIEAERIRLDAKRKEIESTQKVNKDLSSRTAKAFEDAAGKLSSKSKSPP